MLCRLRTSLKTFVILVLLAAAALLLIATIPESLEPPRQAPEAQGVVVEELAEGSVLARAGLRPGDVLLSWERCPNPPNNPRAASGTIESIFDWLWLDWDQRARGRVRLVVERATSTRTIEIPMGFWGAQVRPRFSDAIRESYLEGKAHLEKGEVKEAIDTWQVAADTVSGEASASWKCWLRWKIGKTQGAEKETLNSALGSLTQALAGASEPLCRVLIWQAIGEVQEESGSLASSERAYSGSLDLLLELRGDSLAAATTLTHLSNLAWERDQLDSAEELDQRAYRLRVKLASGSLDLAASLINLGNLAWVRGKLDEAKAHHTAALEIHRDLAPGSEFEASTLNNLAVVSRGLGELEEAEGYLRRALSIYERKNPKSPEVVNALSNLGIVAFFQGNPRLALERHRRTLELQEELVLGSLEEAKTLNNMGIAFVEMGDLAQAEECHERALGIQERHAPKSLSVAFTLGNLGTLAFKRGSLERAQDSYLRSSEILAELVPESVLYAKALNNLGTTELALGHAEKARVLHVQALNIQEELAPHSLDVADSLDNLGTVTVALGDLRGARHLYFRSLAVRRERAPNGLLVAISLANLGDLFLQEGDLDPALELHQEALEIRKRLAPGSAYEAESHFAIGEIRRRRAETDAAIESFLAGIGALEHQMYRFGGSALGEASFRTKFSPQVHRAVELLHGAGRSPRALRILEQWRAQSFLAQLAERDLLFSMSGDAGLESERRRLEGVYDRTQKELSEIGADNDAPRVEALLRRLREVRDQLDQVRQRLREASPGLAALRDPEPLDLAGIREVLDRGTVLLSYSVGEDRTVLFVVTREEGLHVETLPVGAADLRRRVHDFREVILRALPGDRTGARRALESLGRNLYGLLVAPVEQLVEKGKRILVLPDGALHRLPWGVLVRQSGRYLVEWKPVHTALSATVYAELKRHRPQHEAPSRDPLRLAAFGDPWYPERIEEGGTLAVADVHVRSAVERGLFDWHRLPYSRDEVESIASLYPPSETQTFLGPEATEEAVKLLGGNGSSAEEESGVGAPLIVHFATHGYVDDRFPLNSALVLSIPEDHEEGRDNGLLQVWEIFERLRLKSDLVVLSACGSALGEELGGEGLIGLTRAFQYAGARSVAATLWNVRDEATAELMVRFYLHLRAGLSKDQALRAAQMELLREPVDGKDLSAPFYWAAFQIYGDWT